MLQYNERMLDMRSLSDSLIDRSTGLDQGMQGYRSSQQSPYWTNTSYWLTNPPQQQQQQQQQQYMYVQPANYMCANVAPTYMANPQTTTYYYI